MDWLRPKLSHWEQRRNHNNWNTSSSFIYNMQNRRHPNWWNTFRPVDFEEFFFASRPLVAMLFVYRLSTQASAKVVTDCIIKWLPRGRIKHGQTKIPSLLLSDSKKPTSQCKNLNYDISAATTVYTGFMNKYALIQDFIFVFFHHTIWWSDAACIRNCSPKLFSDSFDHITIVVKVASWWFPYCNIWAISFGFSAFPSTNE